MASIGVVKEERLCGSMEMKMEDWVEWIY